MAAYCVEIPSGGNRERHYVLMVLTGVCVCVSGEFISIKTYAGAPIYLHYICEHRMAMACEPDYKRKIVDAECA